MVYGEGAAQTIQSLRIERIPVFPETTAALLPWYLRLANRLHHQTRDSVIRGEVLLHEGDAFDSLRVRESERLLRQRGIFESARITCAHADSGYAGTIRVQDLWTLGLILSYEKQADISSLTLGLRDSNFLGTGNSIRWLQTISTDQDAFHVSADFPRLRPGRALASLAYTDEEGSRGRFASIGRSIETEFDHWSWGAIALTTKGRQRFFHSGEETGSSPFRLQRYGIHLGRYRTARLQAGYGVGWITQRLAPRGNPRSSAPQFVPPPAIERIRIGAPLAFVGLMRRRFMKSTNLERYRAIEDSPLGWSASLVVAPNLRRTEDRAHALAVRSVLQGSALARPTLQVSGELAGLLFLRSSGRADERALRATTTLGWQPDAHALTIAQASVLAGADRPEAAVFYLGTDSGLRGFPTREFEAREYILGTLEQRFWSGVEILWTGLGGNLFVDVARPSLDGRMDDEHWRSGWGCGLLLGLRKSAQQPVRFEIAWRTDRAAPPVFSITSDSWLRIIPFVHLPSPTEDLRQGLR